MALADRDYYRSSTRTGRPRRRPGALALISANTWLIIINVAVFLVGNVLLGRQAIYLESGIEWLADSTDAQRSQARVQTEATYKHPTRPADVFFHPVYLVGTAPDGQPVGVVIGRQILQKMPLLDGLGHFSTGRLLKRWEVWRVVTFQFLHANPDHLIFNMLGLWFIGGMVESVLGRRRYLAFYLVCGVAGAMMYLLLNLLGWGVHLRLPGVLFSDPFTPLIGASAGVFGVLVAAAFLNPRETIYVLFAIPMQLRTAVYLFVLFALINLLRHGDNAGGDAAHMGGALAGAFFIRHPHLLHSVLRAMGFPAHAPSPS